MDKWADFLISAVRYNSARTHIDSVEVREDLVDKAGLPQNSLRSEVVTNIKKGITYVTIFKGKDGWQKGQEVRTIMVVGQEFIRTDPNATACDNLDRLPEF